MAKPSLFALVLEVVEVLFLVALLYIGLTVLLGLLRVSV